MKLRLGGCRARYSRSYQATPNWGRSLGRGRHYPSRMRGRSCLVTGSEVQERATVSRRLSFRPAQIHHHPRLGLPSLLLCVVNCAVRQESRNPRNGRLRCVFKVRAHSASPVVDSSVTGYPKTHVRQGMVGQSRQRYHDSIPNGRFSPIHSPNSQAPSAESLSNRQSSRNFTPKNPNWHVR
jgi:hypothetical protein